MLDMHRCDFLSNTATPCSCEVTKLKALVGMGCYELLLQ